MALDATFWSSGWEDVRIDQDWSSAVCAGYTVSGDYRTGWLYLFSNVLQATSFDDENLNSAQFGRLYLYYGATSYPIRWVQANGVHLNPPSTVIVNRTDNRQPCTYLVQPAPTFSSAAGYLVVTSDNNVASGGVNWNLRHFQPKAYSGNPARVIAAILLDMGADASWVDTDNFSDADDGQAAMTTEPDCLVVREIGETVADTIKRVARHSNDILCVNMSGKVSLVSRSSPPAGPTSMTAADTLGENSWRYGYEYIANRATVAIGDFYLNTDVGGAQKPDDAWQQPLQVRQPITAAYSALFGTYLHYTPASAPWGRRVLDEVKAERVVSGQIIKKSAVHLPYFNDEDCRDALMERLQSEALLRRVLTVSQDLRGLDYDVGYEVAGIAITGDGETIAAATCIAKDIDFQSLTVLSTLLEEV